MEGKAWELCIHAMTSDKQIVDTGGWCLMKNLEALSYKVHHRVGGHCVHVNYVHHEMMAITYKFHYHSIHHCTIFLHRFTTLITVLQMPQQI